jgi:Cellulase (glycosyl hydrolase family 5)
MRRFLLILPLIVATAFAARAVSPSGRFGQRLQQLQRHGSCSALPRFGVSTHQGRNPDDANIRLATEIGAQIVRMDVPWAGLEHQGQYDFAPYDHLINGLRQAGKSIVIVLAYGHPDHSDGRGNSAFPLPPRTPQQLAAYDRYAQAVATRYHGPDIAYEIWNEPNLDLFWPPAFDPKAYGALLSEAARAIRAVQPNAVILPAGLANENDPARFLRSLAESGALNDVNGITFHPYRQDDPENSLYDIAEFQKALAARTDLPLWITEWGYSEAWLIRAARQDVQKRQAVMIARLMLTAALAGAKAVMVYDLIDDGTNPGDQESSFGLDDYNYRPKPAAAAFRTLAGLTSQCDTYDFAANLQRSIITARFTGKSVASDVIWAYRSGRAQDYCVDAVQAQSTELRDVLGDRMPLVNCPGRTGVSLSLSEAAGPLVLTTKLSN